MIKLVVGVTLICIALLIALGVATKMLDESWTRRNKNRYVASNLALREALYNDCQIDYQNFGSALCDWLAVSARDYNLEVPERASDVFCPEVSERVDRRNEALTFRYRLRRKDSSAIIGGKLRSMRNPEQTKAVGESLKRNLKAYCKPFCYNGPIITWDRDSYILVEISGIYYAGVTDIGVIEI